MFPVRVRAPSLTLYHSLPPFARHIAASIHGCKLRRWRYGPETERLVSEATERELWGLEQRETWQRARLSRVLKLASESVEHYREEWQRRRLEGDLVSPMSLANWPVLRKETVRGAPKAFLAAGTPVNRLHAEHTSGTTGTPLRLWQSRESLRQWYALMETRWRGWYGLSRQDRWAILGGQMVSPIHQRKPPFWVWNSGLSQLYLSSYHLSAESCASYLQALSRWRVVYLWGYASSLFSLALFARERRLEPPHLKVVISNAEPLYLHQRALIGQVFGCPVRDTYGVSEMVCAASECEAGNMHLWPEAGIYEVLHDERDEPVSAGEIGRLVCTGLLNPDMPLIRYEVGDRVAVAPPGEQCACGRTLPILLSVEGRSDDVILTPDGRRIGRLDPVFKCEIPIHEGQIVQESLSLVRLVVVPGPGFTREHEKSLVSALQQHVGDMQVQLETVKEIPRSVNGKFRAVISRVKPAQALKES